ncbi:hypothetical protein AGMMS49992_29610 [Clostridia bacterium]|nr:hypothetical protein AGMMS49992_29610 [Clostridia bacterium]
MRILNHNKYKQHDETTDGIISYIQSDIRVGAIMLTGAWGTGKTFYIERVLRKELRWSAYIYIVSLFGIDKPEQLISKVKDVYSPLTSKFFSISAALSMTALITILISLLDPVFQTLYIIYEASLQPYRFLQFISTPAAAGNLGKIIGALLSLMIVCFYTRYLLLKPKPTRMFKKVILVFDDFERTSLDLKTAMGLINDYLEMGIKVIIVTNEDEITSDREEYLKYKEKIVYKTFAYICNTKKTISAMVEDAIKIRRINSKAGRAIVKSTGLSSVICIVISILSIVYLSINPEFIAMRIFEILLLIYGIIGLLHKISRGNSIYNLLFYLVSWIGIILIGLSSCISILYARRITDSRMLFYAIAIVGVVSSIVSFVLAGWLIDVEYGHSIENMSQPIVRTIKVVIVAEMIITALFAILMVKASLTACIGMVYTVIILVVALFIQHDSISGRYIEFLTEASFNEITEDIRNFRVITKIISQFMPIWCYLQPESYTSNFYIYVLNQFVYTFKKVGTFDSTTGDSEMYFIKYLSTKDNNDTRTTEQIIQEEISILKNEYYGNK